MLLLDCGQLPLVANSSSWVSIGTNQQHFIILLPVPRACSSPELPCPLRESRYRQAPLICSLELTSRWGKQINSYFLPIWIVLRCISPFLRSNNQLFLIPSVGQFGKSRWSWLSLPHLTSFFLHSCFLGSTLLKKAVAHKLWSWALLFKELTWQQGMVFSKQLPWWRSG